VPIIHQKGRNRVCAAALAIQAPVTRMSQAEMIKKIPLLQNAAKAMSATISADVGAA
jgi:DNA-binding IclR family transcriptional regulator